MRISDSRAPRSRPTRPGGWLRALSVTLLIAVWAVAGPSVTPALADSTGISGTVFNSLTHSPAPAVQASVYDSSGVLVSSTCTGFDGRYVFGGLNAGDYRVGFESTQGNFKVCGGRTNYLPAFYDGQATLAAAQTVTVKAGATTAGIDATLSPGGAIAGTITDASTSGPAANVEVDAFDGAGVLVSATCTATDGSYALFSLATGSYRVQALNSTSCGSSTPYRDQFYDGQVTLADARSVAVNVTQTTSGIDVALIPISARTLTVKISGPGSVGFSPSGVSCTRSCILPVTGSPTITLTGAPAFGYSLAGWSGAGCAGAFVCTVRMTGDRAVTASFVAAGSGSGSGSPRRVALWQLGVATPTRNVPGGVQLALPLDLPAPPELRDLSGWEAMLADYGTTGLTVHSHPLALLRDRLPGDAVTSRDLETLRHGTRVQVGGLVVARQRPGTANGVVFVLLEDEYGTINLILPSQVYERHRLAVRTEPLMIVEGKLERFAAAGGAINVLVDRVDSIATPDRIPAEVKSFSMLDEQVRRGLAEQNASSDGEVDDFRAVAPPVMSFASGRRR